MNTITEDVFDYINLRRSLGFKLERYPQALLQFADFLEQQQASYITQKLALAWAQQPQDVQPATWARRLNIARGFARYRQAADPRTEIPATGLLSIHATRPKPYLYSDAEVESLLQAAHNMPCYAQRYALLPRVYSCLFGLLSVSGMRLGEAIQIALNDVDLDAMVLTVRNAKYDRTRWVPLHASTCAVLADYIERRQRHFVGRSVSDKLFVSSQGTALYKQNIQSAFRNLSRRVGLRAANDSHGPRIHDLRHRFAVKTLENWYRQGQDPERLLPVLSTYLGHVNISDTYWYLEGTPGLMFQAMRRLEQRWEGRS